MSLEINEHPHKPEISFLNKLKGEKDHRNYFLIYLQENYVAEVGYELVTFGSGVRHASKCTMEPRLVPVSSDYFSLIILFDNPLK